MTEPLQFQLQTTTGKLTKEVMREHLETFHVLAIE